MPGGTKRSTTPLTPWPAWAGCGVHLAALAPLLGSTSSAGRPLAGRVFEEGREVPVGGAALIWSRSSSGSGGVR